MRGVPSEALRAFVVWLPTLSSDAPQHANEGASEFVDARVKYFWNANKIVGETFGRTLELDQLAWDVYFVYNRGVTWHEGSPSLPAYWMHQLGGLEDHAPFLDSAVLREEIEALIR